MNLKEYITNLGLAEGQTHRGNCPVCKRKNTFTAKNDMGTLMWNCYAHSCKVSGATKTNLTAEEIRRYMTKEGQINAPNYIKLPECIVIDYKQPALSNLCDKYGLNPARFDLRWDVREERVVFPIYEHGVIVDAVGRATTPTSMKWKRYGTARVPFVAGIKDVAVVVEDAISACVVNSVAEAAGFALLGTMLLSEHVDKLRQYRRVIVALDPDAMVKSIQYTRALRGQGIDCFAMNLYDDLKYREQDDIQSLQQIIGADIGTRSNQIPTKQGLL